MDDLARDYIERYAKPHKRASSLRNDRQMLEKIILPKLKALRVRAVTRRDIETLHHSLKQTPYRANRVLALLSKMFSLAMEWGWRPDNAAKGLPRYPEDRRETWLTAEQVEDLLTALDNYSDQSAANAIRLLIVTGAREGEVLSATWDQFDLKRGIWTKPSHHTKQKKIEHTPLSETALQLLWRMHGMRTSPALFPGQKGARVTIRRPWVQVCRAAGLATADRFARHSGTIQCSSSPDVFALAITDRWIFWDHAVWVSHLRASEELLDGCRFAAYSPVYLSDRFPQHPTC